MRRIASLSPLALAALVCLPACAASPQPTDAASSPGVDTGIYPDEVEHPVPADLSKFKQPASLVADLKRIQTGPLKQRLAVLVEKSRRDQVFVQGGTFQMGDFGPLQSEEKLPWDSNSHSGPLHEVTLDSYSISKYKVTLAEFDVYAEANKVPSVQTDEVYTTSIGGRPPSRSPDKPAGTTWYQAKAYCQWLGKLTQQPFDLPTEAQWEYAARDRGRFIVYPTSNGKLEWNVNVASYELKKAISRVGLPIAMFPPSRMGLYDLAKNTMDWMEDWYAADYYEGSDRSKNPRGPATGTEKVQRSSPMTNGGGAMTMSRRFAPPRPDKAKSQDTSLDGFRCAVNSLKPLR